MRGEYLVRVADGKRHTVAFQEQMNGETVYVDRYSGIPLPAASMVQRLDRPEWSSSMSSSVTPDHPGSVVLRPLNQLKIAAIVALSRVRAMFHLQRSAIALAAGQPQVSGMSLNS